MVQTLKLFISAFHAEMLFIPQYLRKNEIGNFDQFQLGALMKVGKVSVLKLIYVFFFYLLLFVNVNKLRIAFLLFCCGLANRKPILR